MHRISYRPEMIGNIFVIQYNYELYEKWSKFVILFLCEDENSIFSIQHKRNVIFLLAAAAASDDKIDLYREL